MRMGVPAGISKAMEFLETKATLNLITLEQAKSNVQTLLGKLIEERQTRFPGAGVQVSRLWQFLTKSTNWLIAPASTKYHLCVEGGLLIHSVGVTVTACMLHELLAPMIPLDSVLLCGLFHDVGKVWGNVLHETKTINHPDKEPEHREECVLQPRYEPTPLKSGKPSEAAPFKYTEGGTNMEIAVRSLRLVERFVDLTEAEAQAIHGHDGQFISSNHCYAHHEDPLTLILHTADMWTGHVIEGQMDVLANNRHLFNVR